MESRRRTDRSEGASTSLDDAWREHRPYLLDVAYRMLGSITDAEDIAQEAFVRLMRADADDIDDLRGWLIVVVSRLCLDQLRSARSRRELPATDRDVLDRPGRQVDGADPADRVTLDDSVQAAMRVVLERLSPAERTAFVLHDVFGFSFDVVGSIVGRSPTACRQLASRARRRIRDDAGASRFDVDLAGQRLVAERFIAACAGGDVERLMHLLDPDVVGDAELLPLGTRVRPFVGRNDVASNVLRFLGPESGVTLVSQTVDGRPGVLGFVGGELAGVFVLTPRDGSIVHIHGIIDSRRFGAASVPRP
jgi:RNA polymerase sigma-70 factor (ECF subfamily)